MISPGIKRVIRMNKLLAMMLLPFFLMAVSGNAFAAGNPCNPCAPKAKNPCAATSDRIDPKLVTRPAGTSLATGDNAALIKEGERLWNDKGLSTNSLSCQTCHQGNGAFNVSFAKPYPHFVKMANARSGLKKIALDEMIQFCLMAPMATKPLPWDSRELAALTAYVREIQKGFKPKSNP